MPSIISLSDITRSKFDRLKKSFSCQNKELEQHIKQYAFNHQKEGLFQTYFYVDNADSFLGYHPSCNAQGLKAAPRYKSKKML